MSSGAIHRMDGKEEEVSLKVFLGTFRPISTIEYVFGICRLPLAGDRLATPGKLAMSLSFLTSTTATATYFVCRIYPVSLLGTPYAFGAFKELPNYFIFAQYWLACLLNTSIRNKANVKIIREIHRLDTALRLNETGQFYKKEQRKTIAGFFVLMMAHVLISLCDFLSDGVLSLSGALVILIYFLQDLGALMFCKLILTLNARLEILNEHVNDIKENGETDFVTDAIKRRKPVSLSNKKPLSMHTLASLYHKIGDICCQINDVYNIQLFLTLVSAFTYIIVIIWFTLSRFKFNDQENNLLRAAAWCTRCICNVTVLCLSCQKLTSTRITTRVLVNDVVMEYERPAALRAQAKAFMALIESWTLGVSVYDMFLVDVTLMLKFISVATTYLIVIIQITHFL